MWADLRTYARLFALDQLEVIDQKVGELDLRIQQLIKTESAAVREQLQSDLGGRCRGLQRETHGTHSYPPTNLYGT